MGCKRLKSKWNDPSLTILNCSSSKEFDSIYMIELEGSSLLRSPFIETNDWFKQILWPIRPSEGWNC